MKYIIFTIGLLITACNLKEKKEQNSQIDQRPNIVFIMSDDHAYQAISAYNDKLIQTPNIDRIAKEGILFTNATVTNSICAPSRAVILTGKHSHLNGKIDNLSDFDTTNVTFPQLFKQAGYQTAMFGKLHFGNNPKGFDEFKILPGQGDYYNPKFITAKGDTIIQGYVTDIITDLTLDWMEKRRDTSKPFLLMYLHKAPHRNWLPAEKYYKAYTKKTFPLPATLFDDYKTRGASAKTAEMNILKHMYLAYDDKLSLETIKELNIDYTGLHNYPINRMNQEQRASWDAVYGPINEDFKERYSSMNDSMLMVWKYQRYMQDYLGTIASVDDNVGRLLNYLDDNKLSENTMVVYTSDQGFYLGEHGWFDKRFMYDESFKTPLLIKWPNKITPGTTENEMVQNLDFAQTFLDVAGIKAPEDMQGKSLVPLLTGHNEVWDRDALYYHYYEYPAEHAVKRHYGIATKNYKLIHFYYDVDEWELYDRLIDPQELNNVYNDPKYTTVVKEMKEKLKELRKKYKDSDALDNHYIKLYNEQKQEGTKISNREPPSTENIEHS
ncbi:sulfatase family protein [Aestuariibaculum suncheonense]|uniref:Sulfatase n=1 Tax=Aestuariibaculum suncheonense TaxID=1028745 RepID=A0A8J6UAU0_9FLAO|nr:sulfatase [Aestuariibaculum suncheonense]MBD0834752.1 sulfatase [Aestuariibaculum suncheonense]